MNSTELELEFEALAKVLAEAGYDDPQQIARRMWVQEHGEEVARSFIELLSVAFPHVPRKRLFGFRIGIRVVKVIKAVAANPPSDSARSPRRPPRTVPYMRYVAAECVPGQSNGKALRPRTVPRNGSHFVSRPSNGDSPFWHNLVRELERSLDHVESAELAG